MTTSVVYWLTCLEYGGSWVQALVSQTKVNMLASSMVDHGFKPWSVKPKLTCLPRVVDHGFKPLSVKPKLTCCLEYGGSWVQALVSQTKVNMLASSMVDHGFKPWSVKPKLTCLPRVWWIMGSSPGQLNQS